jgi:hypothetical protein
MFIFFLFHVGTFAGDDANFQNNQLEIYLVEPRSVDLDDTF